MKPKHSQFSPMSSLLGRGDTAGLVALAEHSARLEKTLKSWPALRGVTFAVGPLKQDKLKLFVGTPSALTRLRQSLPSLLELLQQHGWNVKHIQLQVQTGASLSKANTPKAKQASFGPAARKAWLELEKQLPESPVLEATRALNKHHRFK